MFVPHSLDPWHHRKWLLTWIFTLDKTETKKGLGMCPVSRNKHWTWDSNQYCLFPKFETEFVTKSVTNKEWDWEGINIYAEPLEHSFLMWGCLCVCRYLSIFMGTQAYTCRPENNPGCHPPEYHLLPFRPGLSLALSSPIGLDWPTKELQPSSCLPSLHRHLQIHTTMPGIFTWVLDIELRSSCLQVCFTTWTISNPWDIFNSFWKGK